MARLKTEVSGLLCWNCGHHYDEYKFRLCPDCGVDQYDDPKYDLDEEPIDDDDVPFEDEHEEIDDDDTF